MHAPTPTMIEEDTWRHSSAIIQILKPEHFTGKHGTSVKAWLMKTEWYLTVLNVNDEVTVLLASALLKDYAKN